jgi:hypothetical protein
MKTVLKLEFYVTIESSESLDRKKVHDSAKAYILPDLRKQILAAKLKLSRTEYDFLCAELGVDELTVRFSDNLDLLQKSSTS